MCSFLYLSFAVLAASKKVQLSVFGVSANTSHGGQIHVAAALQRRCFERYGCSAYKLASGTVDELSPLKLTASQGTLIKLAQVGSLSREQIAMTVQFLYELMSRQPPRGGLLVELR